MSEDARARFVIAQQLIAEGRTEEARMLLRTLDDVPEAQDWAARLERGEVVDPNEVQWHPEQPAPGLPPVTLPEFKPLRFVMSLLLALVLVVPILQMLTFSGAVYPSQTAALRGEARARVEVLCQVLVNRAIREDRLEEEFGSCLDWSLNLTNANFREVVRCHAQTERDDLAFERCVIDLELFPDDLTNFGQNV